MSSEPWWVTEKHIQVLCSPVNQVIVLGGILSAHPVLAIAFQSNTLQLCPVPWTCLYQPRCIFQFDWQVASSISHVCWHGRVHVVIALHTTKQGLSTMNSLALGTGEPHCNSEQQEILNQDLLLKNTARNHPRDSSTLALLALNTTLSAN